MSCPNCANFKGYCDCYDPVGGDIAAASARKARATRLPAVIASESIIYFDCDDTLVLWSPESVATDLVHNAAGEAEATQFVDIIDPYDGKNVRLGIHTPHVKLLKNRFKRGSTIIVWSANGYRWAEAVVYALGIQSYVHFIQSKPQAYVDDLPAAEILGERMYLKPDSAWGNK